MRSLAQARAPRFHGLRVIENDAQIRALEIGEVEKMSWRVAHHCLRFKAAAGHVKLVDGFGDIIVGDNQRRQQAHDIVARRNGQQLVLQGRGLEFRIGNLALDAHHQAGAADVFDDRWDARP